MKLTQEFLINYPLSHKVVRNLRIVTETVGTLVITGTAYCDTNFSKLEVFDRYNVDIDFVRWNGTDIQPVLDVVGGMDDITEYCIKEVAKLFEDEIIANRQNDAA